MDKRRTTENDEVRRAALLIARRFGRTEPTIMACERCLLNNKTQWRTCDRLQRSGQPVACELSDTEANIDLSKREAVSRFTSRNGTRKAAKDDPLFDLGDFDEAVDRFEAEHNLTSNKSAKQRFNPSGFTKSWRKART